MEQSEYVIVTKDHNTYEELTKEYEDSLTGEAEDDGSVLESVNMTTIKLTKEEAKELSCDSDVVAVEENIDISLNSLSESKTSETSENNSKTAANKTSDGTTDNKKADKNKTGDGTTGINKTDSDKSKGNKTDNSKTSKNKTSDFKTATNKTDNNVTGNINSSSDVSSNVSSSDKSGEKVNSDDTDHWNLKMINAENADDEETLNASSDTIKVAIIDSGVDYIDQVEVKERINLIPEEEGMSPLCDDTSGHGTAVAGIIAGTSSNENDTEGINSNIELYSIKVFDEEGEAPLSSIIEAIYICIDRDVDIINMSFGTTEYSEALEMAVNDAYEAGILIIAAAGNTGEEDGTVEYPAAFDNVMYVGSVDAEADVSDFSSTDGDVDVYAPGEVITSTYFMDGTITSSGTSMAVPHVVGIASLLWQEDTTKSVNFIKTLIESSANDLGDEETYSYGIVDYEYAEEIYDDFEGTYDEIITENLYDLENLENYLIESNKNGICFGEDEDAYNKADKFIEFIEEELTDQYNNTSDIEVFEDVGTAKASWSKDSHETLVTAAKSVTDCNGNSYTTRALTLLKLGIRLNDNNIYTKPYSNDKSRHRWWHSLKDTKNGVLTNYISNALYLNNLILTSNCTISNVTKPSGMAKAVFNEMSEELKYALTATKDNYGIKKMIKAEGYSVNNPNLRYVYWGMLLHILSDAYAHQTYEYSSGTYQKIDETDDTSYISNRYSSAKKVVKNIMSRRIDVDNPGSSDTVHYVDLALSTDYYDGSFYLRNFKEYIIESGLKSESYFEDEDIAEYIGQISYTSGFLTYSQIQSKYKNVEFALY